ncbi:hypothetical protein LTR08_000967 [Meristemomyces frigidus]|nr:hypothetical protein LTR08_000967 [Meristemomyces frigidus]
MATPTNAWDSPVNVWHEDSNNNNNHNNHVNNTHNHNAAANDDLLQPPKPLSGPGTSRQTRRLQLRNAGFRGPAVPSRKVTPKSLSSSSASAAWSAVSGLMSGSDAENCSPSGARAGSVHVAKSRRASGVLQEIGVAKPKRQAQARGRVMSGRVFAPDVHVQVQAATGGQECGGDEVRAGLYGEAPHSPPATKALGTLKARSLKTRAKMNQKRRSVSGEARLYIDHLESELAAAQTQLAAVNSPTVTREQSHRMRTLNAETRQLHADLAEWETKYDRRVQDVVDEHCDIEASLRLQLRKLEQSAEATNYRLEELRSELATAHRNTEAAEAANVNLEKRLEMLSELLAMSPTKIDLHAASPARHRGRHQRQKSTLPRFPTASALVTTSSPERGSTLTLTQLESPLQPYHHHAHANTSPAFPARALDPSPSFPSSPYASSSAHDEDDAPSLFSPSASASSAAPFTTTRPLEPLDPTAHAHANGNANAHFNPWTLQALQNARARPARRMRRFGAGSVCPKALILPSTAGWGELGGLARSETTPAFSFAGFEGGGGCDDRDGDDRDDGSGGDEQGEGAGGEGRGSPRLWAGGRRRASTTADLRTLANLAARPLGRLGGVEEGGGGDCFGSGGGSFFPASASARSQATTREMSTLGSAVGRNLMDELCAARTGESGDGEGLEGGGSICVGGEEGLGGEGEEETVVLCASDEGGAVVVRRELGEPAALEAHTGCFYERLAAAFAELWCEPFGLARRLARAARGMVRAVHTRVRVPEGLRDVQWWLVGVLLGPMARRRMLGTTSGAGWVERRRGGGEARALLREDAGALAGEEEADGLVYFGTPRPSLAGGEGAMSRVGLKREGLGYGVGAFARGGEEGSGSRHYHGAEGDRSKPSPWLWLKFSLTLAVAVGVAFKDGPGSVLAGGAREGACGCVRCGRGGGGEGGESEGMVRVTAG